MSLSITLPAEYGWVLLSASASLFLTSFHTHLTSDLRTAAAVPYPNSYASAEEAVKSPEKYRFNCAQRAHANFTENHAAFVTALLVAGLRFPVWSASLGASWSLARVLYALGYTKKGAKNASGRHWGTWWAFPHVALLGMAVASSWKLISAGRSLAV